MNTSSLLTPVCSCGLNPLVALSLPFLHLQADDLAEELAHSAVHLFNTFNTCSANSGSIEMMTAFRVVDISFASLCMTKPYTYHAIIWGGVVKGHSLNRVFPLK